MEVTIGVYMKIEEVNTMGDDKKKVCISCECEMEEGEAAECEEVCTECCQGDCDNCEFSELM